MWIRAGLGLFFLLLASATVWWTWHQEKVGPQETRVKKGIIRVPAAMSQSREKSGSWLFWIVIVAGGLMVIFFLAAKIRDGYRAAILVDGGKEVAATVTLEGLPREDCTYAFEANGMRYTGRGPQSLDKGDEVRVSYLPENPQVNRPARGLVGDIAFGVFSASILLVAGIVLLASLRKPGPYEESEVRSIVEKLKAADFLGAIDVLRYAAFPNKNADVLTLADGIIRVCCERADLSVYESGIAALAELDQITDDPPTRRELGFFREELVASEAAWRKFLREGSSPSRYGLT